MQSTNETTPLRNRDSVRDNTLISCLTLFGIICSMFIVFICVFCITYIYDNSDVTTATFIAFAAAFSLFCLLWCFSLCLNPHFTLARYKICLEHEDYDKIIAFEYADYESPFEDDNDIFDNIENKNIIANKKDTKISYHDLEPKQNNFFY